MDFLKRFGWMVAGLIITLAWWSFKGEDDEHEGTDHIPSKVWEGGVEVTMVVETTVPARASAWFEKGYLSDEDHQSLESWQMVEPGTHTFVIDVPPGTSGSCEVSTDEADVGDTTTVRVLVGGKVVAEDSVTLEEELKPGWALGAQVEIEDFAQGR